MPLLDITNPTVINFLVESYNKTARLRLKWNELNAERVKEASILKRPEKGYTTYDVFKASMIGGMPAITRDHITGGYNKIRRVNRDGMHIPGVADMKKGHSIVDVGLGDPKEDPRLARPDTDTTIDPIMRVVDPEDKDIIYKGLPYHGRAVYMKKRSKIAPEDKYYFRETSGWDYGWRLKDSTYFSRNRPQHGRVLRLIRDSKSRTGPQPDPPYYKNPDQTSEKCSD